MSNTKRTQRVREVVHVPGAAKSGLPFSRATRQGELLFLSGHAPFDASAKLVLATFEEQTRLVLDNLRQTLEAAGSNMDCVLKVTALLADITNFSRFNKIYGAYFSAPYPARSCYEVKMAGGIEVEVEAIAFIP